MPSDFDDLLPEIAIYAPKVPDSVAFRFIREVTREMCERAPLWIVNDELAIGATGEEVLTTIANAEIVEIQRAHFGDSLLEAVTLGWLDARFDDWQSLEGTPRYVAQITPNSIIIVPHAAGTLRLRLRLKPSRTATVLPDFLVDQYSSEIGNGAAGRALMLPGQDYTNPQLGAVKETQFQRFLDELAVAAIKGQQRGKLRTTARFF